MTKHKEALNNTTFHLAYISSLVSAYSNIPIFIALHCSTTTYTRNMASLWFTLTVILYIISEIIAVPLRIAPQGENMESGLSGQG
jgi:hypothetical protein